MTTSTPRRSHLRDPRLTALLAVGTLTVGLLAGCSASSDDSASSDVPAAATVGEAGAADGAVRAADKAEGEASTTGDAPTDQQRQVVQTGKLSMRADDAAKATQAVVTIVESNGGRVDDRSEQATTKETGGSSTLTLRIPADKVTSTITALRGIGTVDSVDLQATDVTGAAQDLDARIHALELSVARMDALLAKATTSKDIIDAESALTERQSNLEQLQAERARLADQVSLSTLTVAIYGPDVAPPVQHESPNNFVDALGVGWDSLVSAVSATVIVLGVLLPWLLLAGAAAAGVVAVLRWRRTRRPERSARPGGPSPAYAGTVPMSPAAPPAQHPEPGDDGPVDPQR